MKRKITEEMMRKEKKYSVLLAEQEFLRELRARKEIAKIKEARLRSSEKPTLSHSGDET